MSKIVLAVEFLANQDLLFRDNKDDKVDFDDDTINRGSFIAVFSEAEQLSSAVCYEQNNVERIYMFVK